MVPNPLPRYGVKPLLGTVGGKPRNEIAKPVKEPEDIYALPMESSDDEVEEPTFPTPYADSSDDDAPSRRGDIIPTKFGSKAASKDKEPASESLDLTPKRRSARQPAIQKVTKKRLMEDVEDDESDHTSYKKAKTPAKKMAVGDHMQPGWLLESSIERKTKGQKAGYGRKAGKLRNLTPTFKSHTFDSSSPEKASKFKTIQFKSDDASPDRDIKPPKKFRKNKKNKAGPKPSVLEFEKSPDKPKPELKMPEGYDDSAPGRNLVGFDASLDETLADEPRVLGTGLAHCPMCDEVVDEDSLKTFSKGQRMTIARQTKFCQTHRKNSAQKVWEDKGYPNIDWKNLHKRVAGHHDFIESLIRGASSHYSKLHEDKIQSGKNRTIFKTEEYPSPGYYGLRGMSVMTESLVETFSSLLRERAPNDKLISGRGYTAYIQSVLVPELAVKLIQEDMGNTTLEEARTIMEDSRAVGELLNDDKAGSQHKRSRLETVIRKNGGSSHGHDTSEKQAAADDEKEDLEVPINLKVQTIADSDSELSSLDTDSIADGSMIGTSLLGNTQAVETEDSDSDLTSLDDL